MRQPSGVKLHAEGFGNKEPQRRALLHGASDATTRYSHLIPHLEGQQNICSTFQTWLLWLQSFQFKNVCLNGREKSLKSVSSLLYAKTSYPVSREGHSLSLVSGEFLSSLWTHVTSSSLTLRPNITDQTPEGWCQLRQDNWVSHMLTGWVCLARKPTHVLYIPWPHSALVKSCLLHVHGR